MSVQFDNKNALCEHNLLDNDIHELVLGVPSRETVDAWVDVMDRLFDELPPDADLNFLIDVTAGTQPLGYTMMKMREFVSKHGNDTRDGRMVFLYERDFLATIVRPLTAQLAGARNRNKIRLFPAAQRDAAIEWILKR